MEESSLRELHASLMRFLDASNLIHEGGPNNEFVGILMKVTSLDENSRSTIETAIKNTIEAMGHLRRESKQFFIVFLGFILRKELEEEIGKLEADRAVPSEELHNRLKALIERRKQSNEQAAS